MDSIKFVLIENYELHDIVKTDNVGPGSVFHDMDLYISLAYNNQRTIGPVSLTWLLRIC